MRLAFRECSVQAVNLRATAYPRCSITKAVRNDGNRNPSPARSTMFHRLPGGSGKSPATDTGKPFLPDLRAGVIVDAPVDTTACIKATLAVHPRMQGAFQATAHPALTQTLIRCNPTHAMFRHIYAPMFVGRFEITALAPNVHTRVTHPPDVPTTLSHRMARYAS